MLLVPRGFHLGMGSGSLSRVKPGILTAMSAALALPVLARAAGLPRVLCSNIAGSPTSVVPGPAGWTYRPGNDLYTSMPRVAVSPDGLQWAFVTWIKSGGTERVAVIHGSGLATGGSNLVARVGGASHVVGRSFDMLDANVAINNAGQVLISGSISGATADDQFVARWQSGVFTEVAREGQQVPGMPAGTLYWLVVDSPSITSTGAAAIRTLLGGNTTGQAWILTSSPTTGTVLARTGTTVPALQLASVPQAISSFVFDQCLYSDTGDVTFYRATLNGPILTDQVAVLNGNVVAQERFVVPASGMSSHVAVLSPQDRGLVLSPSGNHFVLLGGNASERDWASLDNTVFVQTFEPIVPGSTEVFDDTSPSDCFIAASVTDSGKVALAARSSSGDEVIVLMNDRVILREGDPVDLNGNGVADDDLFVNRIGEGGLTYTADNRLFATVSVVNGADFSVGVVLLTLDASQCNDIDFNNDSIFPDIQDIADFIAVFGGGPCPTGGCDGIDFNRDDLFPDTEDIAAFLTVFGGGDCP